MSKASLLELCHGEKKYETFSISEYNERLLSDCRAKNFRANECVELCRVQPKITCVQDVCNS